MVLRRRGVVLQRHFPAYRYCEHSAGYKSRSGATARIGDQVVCSAQNDKFIWVSRRRRRRSERFARASVPKHADLLRRSGRDCVRSEKKNGVAARRPGSRVRQQRRVNQTFTRISRRGFALDTASSTGTLSSTTRSTTACDGCAAYYPPTLNATGGLRGLIDSTTTARITRSPPQSTRQRADSRATQAAAATGAIALRVPASTHQVGAELASHLRGEHYSTSTNATDASASLCVLTAS